MNSVYLSIFDFNEINFSNLAFYSILSFHNSKEEIVKGYDVVPQLNDNIRLTIEEYRNKLYQFIQNKPLVRLSNSAQSVGAAAAHIAPKSAGNVQQHQPQAPPPQTAQQHHQQVQSTSTNNNSKGNLVRSNTYHYAQQQYAKPGADTPEVQSELIDHYAQQKQVINYQSSYNNGISNNNNSNYDANNQSDDNNSTTSEGNTPPQYASNQIVGNASAIVGGASNAASAVNNSRKKHPSDFQNNTVANNSNSMLGSLGSATYSGVAFGRTIHASPQTQLQSTSNSYSKNHAQQRALAAATAAAMKQNNSSMVN